MKYEVPVWEKANLTLEEAAAYSGIGINRINNDTLICGRRHYFFYDLSAFVKGGINIADLFCSENNHVFFKSRKRFPALLRFRRICSEQYDFRPTTYYRVVGLFGFSTDLKRLYARWGKDGYSTNGWSLNLFVPRITARSSHRPRRGSVR